MNAYGEFTYKWYIYTGIDICLITLRDRPLQKVIAMPFLFCL